MQTRQGAYMMANEGKVWPTVLRISVRVVVETVRFSRPNLEQVVRDELRRSRANLGANIQYPSIHETRD